MSPRDGAKDPVAKKPKEVPQGSGAGGAGFSKEGGCEGDAEELRRQIAADFGSSVLEVCGDEGIVAREPLLIYTLVLFVCPHWPDVWGLAQTGTVPGSTSRSRRRTNW